MPSDLGKKIQALRKKKGLTLEQLAKLSESSKSYIWELENRNPPRPSAEKIAKIANALEHEIEYFLDDEGRMSEQTSEDAKFYREYRKLDAETRLKIRKLAKLIGSGE